MPAPALSAEPSSHYLLGPGDKMRITVFNEPDLSREVQVDAQGRLPFPLVHDVPAGGKTVSELAVALSAALASYLRTPQVTVDIVEYRPFFIMGEVKAPGTYPYSPNMTVLGAVARAGGFTDRAAKSKVFIKHPNDTSEVKYSVSDSLPVHAGDSIRIGERIF